ncbi:MAG: ribosome small subunit-dependent GTPase A [Firmicutes bacterium]|nr:ribosome small subunit-dependent GTPase A [Bacillota bacterium]
MRGLVTLLEANRPTVQSEDGQQYLCYLKGRVRRDVGRILVGDQVEFEVTGPGEGRIDVVLPRVNQLVRPPVANVTGLWVIFSLVSPSGNLELLDRRLVMGHLMGLAQEIIFSKVDLVEGELRARLEQLLSTYRAIGYPVWPVSATMGQGLASLVSHPRRGLWVLTGESGAGKSSLLKALIPAAPVATNALSRIGRGQQTTRWVRLYALGNAWLADSPGYTALETQVSDRRRIVEAFPEFRDAACRFADCLHGQEPGCGVQEALREGRIAEWRYRHYRKLLTDWVKSY